MARFFVGQRVKKVAHRDSWFISKIPIPLDATGIISSIGPFSVGDTSNCGRIFAEPADCTVEWDDGQDLAAMFWQLEPILPDHQPVAIADLLSEFPSLSEALGVSA